MNPEHIPQSDSPPFAGPASTGSPAGGALDAPALAARWPGLDLRPVRLNGGRSGPEALRSYTVLDPRGLRVVGEIRATADGRFRARGADGTGGAVFDTVAAALAAFPRAKDGTTQPRRGS